MSSSDPSDLGVAVETEPPLRRRRSYLVRIAALLLLPASTVLVAFVLVNRLWPSPWTSSQKAAIGALWIGHLPALPRDPTNRYANDPRAARLGARLFRDPRLSREGKVSCSSCHKPELSFTDGAHLATGVGVGKRNTPSIVATSYAGTFFWDGRRDSQWAQALGPMESAHEMASTRTEIVREIGRSYRKEYETTFGLLPSQGLDKPASPLGDRTAQAAWRTLEPRAKDAIDRAFSNVAKAISAYERTVTLEPSRFDTYVSHVLQGNNLIASQLLNEDERAGLALFVGRAACVSCHRGPLLTGHEFFSLGLPFGTPGPDAGRADGIDLVKSDPFNCLGKYSDAKPEVCSELRFLPTDHMGFLANFKTPSLRNVTRTAPYMHAGQFATLHEVIDHYRSAPRVPFPEHTDIQPLALSDVEEEQLIAFLGTLDSRIRDPFADERPAPEGD